MKVKLIIQVILFLFPWRIRKYLLSHFLHFELGNGSKIGLSIILAKRVHVGDYSTIGHLNFCKPIDEFYVGNNSNVGTKNYFTGFSAQDPQVIHFRHIEDRQCVFKLGDESGVTSKHYFDCNGGIYIGNFCQIAGMESCFMTHSIDIERNIQDAGKIIVKDYVFVGARCTVLKNVIINSSIVVGACSLVNKSLSEKFTLYAGVPASRKKNIENSQFFYRKLGKV